ncbi:MAG: hypothetical protein M0Z66_06960 [Thermaerobacter sp.]|nr:hypothetical protein [Thermaerobacter sp.]
MQGSRLWTLIISGLLAWLLTLLLGVWGPILAGLAAGRFAPQRGAFRWAALGAFAAWIAWFVVSAATVPIIGLARLLGQIVGIGASGGLVLPVLAAIFAGLIAGVAASAGLALFTASHRDKAQQPTVLAP